MRLKRIIQLFSKIRIAFSVSESSRAALLVREYKREGMKIGNNTHFFSTVKIGEPYLVTIGSNSTVAGNVCLLTHDASIGTQVNRERYSDLCGRISIGNNCFIGYGSIIMYGVHIPDNVIVAAGSVVTKSINESGIIVGGNPARVIGSVEEFKNKYANYFLSLHGKDKETKKSIILESEKLVER